MVENEQQSVIGEVVSKRKAEAQRAASVEEATKELPLFAIRLGSLLRDKIEPPVEIMVPWKDYHFPIESKFGKRDEFSTKLDANIKTDGEAIEVQIGASSYPEDDDKAKRINYVVDVKDLNYYLKIEKGKWHLESKSRETDKPSNPLDIFIGPNQYHSWPSWSREITTEEANRFKGLLEVLETGDVKFEGRTPEKRVLDESTRPQITTRRLR